MASAPSLRCSIPSKATNNTPDMKVPYQLLRWQCLAVSESFAPPGDILECEDELPAQNIRLYAGSAVRSTHRDTDPGWGQLSGSVPCLLARFLRN